MRLIYKEDLDSIALVDAGSLDKIEILYPVEQLSVEERQKLFKDSYKAIKPLNGHVIFNCQHHNIAIEIFWQISQVGFNTVWLNPDMVIDASYMKLPKDMTPKDMKLPK